MLDDGTKNLRQKLYRATQTYPESAYPRFNPERFKWLVDIIKGDLVFEETQGRPVNQVELIAALILDFEELYRQDEKLLYQHSALGGQEFELSTQRTKLQEQRSKAGFSSGVQRKLESSPLRKEWQHLADGYWERNPKLSKYAVGQLIAKERDKGENGNTIRRKITKPK